MKQLSFSAKAALSLTTIASTLSIPAIVHAAAFNFDLTFETADQSIWATGDAFNLTETTFLGVDWNESGGIDPITVIPGIPSVCVLPNPFGGCLIESPAIPSIQTPGVNASTNGTIGFENTLNIVGGEVDAIIPIDLTFIAPDSVNPGETFTLGSSFAFDPDALFSTVGPTISESLDLIFNVAASLGFGGFSTGFDIDERLNLFTLDPDEPLPSLETDFFSVTLGVPELNTTGTLTDTNILTSSGESTFAEGEVNVTNIATSLLGLPPLNGGESFGFGPVEVGFNYNLLTALATLDLALVQDFLLTGSLPGLLAVNGSAPIPFTVGTPIELIAPDDALDFLDISATINFDALFSNATGLQFAPGFDISALGAGLIIPALPDPSFGPLVQIDESFPIEPPIPIYSETFGLDGFNSELVAFQIDVANVPVDPPVDPPVEPPTSVPEPGTLMSLGAVILAGSLVKIRRQAKSRFVPL